MKGISKNMYSIIATITFVLSAAFLILILSLYSKSTAVDGTTVGNIYIGDKETKDAQRETLLSKVATWKRQAQYTISFQNVEMTIGYSETPVVDALGNPVYESDGVTQKIKKVYNGLELLDFDVEKTVNNITKNSKNACYFFVNAEKNQEFKTKLTETYGAVVYGAIDYDLLLNKIVMSAQNMSTVAVFDLHDFVYDNYGNTIVTSITLKNLSSEDIKAIIDAYKEIEILPQEKTTNKLGFSAVKFFAGTTLSNDRLNIIATGLAAVVQETSFTVTVKNQDIFARDYAYKANDSDTCGMTARINVKDGTDLKIINPETTTYTVKLKKISDTELKFELVGCKFINSYEIYASVEESNPLPTMAFERFLTFGAEGMMIDEEKGIYYYVTKPGTTSKIITYTKATLDFNGNFLLDEDGEVIKTPIYLKQEFYKGVSEEWTWNYLPSDYVGGGE